MFKYLILIQIFLNSAWADKVEKFSGLAKENGVVVYTENHDVTFDDNGKVLEAKTIYVSPSGKVLGTLSSDFRKSLSLPEHVFLDDRTKGRYGITRDQGKIFLFNQDLGKPEQRVDLSDEKDEARVQVGCQGFNYFLKDQINHLKNVRTLPVLFMVPGDLSTYKFVLELVRENPDQTFDFKVKIENWFLRAFAPQLEFKYDRKIDRIVWYKGISNIKNESGKTMNVEISYSY